MMSGASPPSKEVSSWSWTLSQLPCTYSTWTSGWAAFHSFTSSLLASTDSSCQASDWKRRVILPPSEPPSPPVQAAAAAVSEQRHARRRRAVWVVPHQLFTAPASIPPVIRCWMTAKTTSEGRVARNAAAASGPRSATPSAPRKWVRTTGRVCFSGVLSRTSAKKNSFHAVMNANSAVATMPGASSGAVTETSVRSRAGAVHGRGLLQLGRHGPYVPDQHPQRERQRPHHVHHDQTRYGSRSDAGSSGPGTAG